MKCTERRLNDTKAQAKRTVGEPGGVDRCEPGHHLAAEPARARRRALALDAASSALRFARTG